MKFIIGKKVGMSRVYDENGKVIPVTVVEVGQNVVTQIKTKDKDGYEAVQVGAGSKSKNKISKPLRGHSKELGLFGYVREIKGLTVNGTEVKVGDALDLAMFTPGDRVKVTGISKGKGFAGAVKRHGFSGMPSSHGHKSVKRHIGSIGQRFPQHTMKGKRMAGRMGNEQTTTRGLRVVTVDSENHLIALKGAVPGNRGGYLEIHSQ